MDINSLQNENQLLKDHIERLGQELQSAQQTIASLKQDVMLYRIGIEKMSARIQAIKKAYQIKLENEI